MMAAMSLLAATPRASSGRSSTRGTTRAAITPRITMTTMISITVKPSGRRERVDRARRAGKYEIEAGITMLKLLAKLTQGDVTQTSLGMVEGSTFAELKRALRDDPQVVKTVLDLPDLELLARLGATERH